MATYNGEKYISDQLNSLLKQSYNNFEVFIRDDGSNDNTVDIIKKYIQLYPGKISLVDDKIKHRGAKDSFFFLLNNVESSYYMFCDQDDYWLSNKIEISLRKIKELEQSHPQKGIMVHTDLIIVDENLNTLYESFWKWGKFNVDLNKKFEFAPFGNVFTGCTMIINNHLKRYIFPVPNYVQMHDQWIGLVATKYGIVDNIKIGSIKYRQHGNNVCSIGNKKRFSLKSILHRKNWFEEIKPILVDLNYGSKMKAYFYKFIYSFSRIFFHN